MDAASSPSNGTRNSCKILFIPDSDYKYLPSDSSEVYGFLIAAAIIELLSCPFIVFLNALVMVAVKTKRRLQTHCNILLASLALTDLMVGLVVQPLHVIMFIILLQGKQFDEVCEIKSAFIISFFIFSTASLFHLALISGERYLAIKYPFIHDTFVTKPRLIVASFLGWFVLPLRLVFTHVPTISIIFLGAVVASIIWFQVLVYKEARRHEKHILSQQVSLEARAKFEKEKRALKLTTVMALAMVLCYFPSFIAFIFRRKIFSHMLDASVYFSVIPMILNSLLNPVIYTIRTKSFRIAFIELLLTKDFQRAEEVERRLFGSPNIVAPSSLEAPDGQRPRTSGEEQECQESNPTPSQ